MFGVLAFIGAKDVTSKEKRTCGDCKTAAQKKMQASLDETLESIQKTEKVEIKYLETIKKNCEVLAGKKSASADYYKSVYSTLTSKGNLLESEIEFLGKLEVALGLDIDHTAIIEPYEYLNQLKKSGLPKIDVSEKGGFSPLLRTGENAHFVEDAELSESRTVVEGYAGGSRGVSVRVMPGLWYRVGSYKGHVISNKKLVSQATGQFIITNQRLIFHPSAGDKAIGIELKKLLSYKANSENLAVFKDGREKGYFFAFDSVSPYKAEVCLSYLINKNKSN